MVEKIKMFILKVIAIWQRLGTWKYVAAAVVAIWMGLFHPRFTGLIVAISAAAFLAKRLGLLDKFIAK